MISMTVLDDDEEQVQKKEEGVEEVEELLETVTMQLL